MAEWENCYIADGETPTFSDFQSPPLGDLGGLSIEKISP